MKLFYRIIASLFPKSKFLPREKITAGYSKLISKDLIEKLNRINLELMLSDEKTMPDKKTHGEIIGVSFLKLIQFDNQWKSTRFLGNLNFVTSLCLSIEFNQTFIYPMRKNWIETLSASGIRINKFMSLSLYRTIMLIQIARSFYKSLIFLFNSLYRNKDFLPNYSSKSNFLHIPNLQSGHFSGEFKYNLVGWLKEHEYSVNNLTITHSNPKIIGAKLKLEEITLEYINLEWRWTTGVVKDFARRLISIFRCGVCFFKAENKSLVLLHLHSILIAHYTLRFLPQAIMECSLFDQSQGSLMPLWTSNLSGIKSKNILLFYAIAAEPDSHLCKDFQPSLWANSSWDEIWVIDKLQRKKLQSVMIKTNVKFREMATPDWIDSCGFVPRNKQSIALFDSEPQQFLYYLSPLVALGIFSEDFYEQFFNGVLERAKFYNFTVLHKSKRSTGKFIEPFYDRIKTEIGVKYKKNYKNIDYNIAPKKLLNSCVASVCQPISTTAVISKALKIPTAFYDPLSRILHSDQALRDIPLLDSSELDNWFDNLRRNLF